MAHVLAGKISADIFGVRKTIVWTMSSQYIRFEDDKNCSHLRLQTSWNRFSVASVSHARVSHAFSPSLAFPFLVSLQTSCLTVRTHLNAQKYSQFGK